MLKSRKLSIIEFNLFLILLMLQYNNDSKDLFSDAIGPGMSSTSPRYCRPMPLKEKNSFRLQNLVNVTLSIEVALHNNEICFPSVHNATPYHNTHTSKSVSLNETIISKTFLSSSKNSNSTAMMTMVKPRLIRE